MLCSWTRHFTLIVPLSTQKYKWVPANCQGNLTKCWEVTCDGLTSQPGGIAILLVTSCYGNRDKLRQTLLAPNVWLHNTVCMGLCWYYLYFLYLLLVPSFNLKLLKLQKNYCTVTVEFTSLQCWFELILIGLYHFSVVAKTLGCWRKLL